MKKKVLATLILLATMGLAQIKVGVTLSLTGSGSSLGIPEKNTLEIMPQYIGNKAVEYIVLDDASDPVKAVANVRTFAEQNVDMIIGSSNSVNAIAMIETVGAVQIPTIALAASSLVISPMDKNRRWMFKTLQSDVLMGEASVEHMARNGVKTLAFMGTKDIYGDSWYNILANLAPKYNIQVVIDERYTNNSTQITENIEKVLAKKPDAVLIGALGMSAIVPQAGLWAANYQGKVYQNLGVATPEFLRVGGKFVEGTYLVSGPMLIADQLPQNHPNRAAALNFIRKYDRVYGVGTANNFGAYMWDAGMLMNRALPIALKNHTPGTPEFRTAIRDALETSRGVVGANGIFTLSPSNHMGLDQRSRVMVQVVGNKFKWLGE